MKNFCTIIDNFLDQDFVKELNEFIIKKEFNPLFVKKNEVDFDSNILHKAIQKIWFENLSDLNENIFGYEVWSNTLTQFNNLSIHVDCDEEHFELTGGEFKCPNFTSILYTGPEHSISGGQLAINLEKRIKHENEFTDVNTDLNDILKDNKNWLKVDHKRNRLVLFDSGHPHCVLPMKNVPIEKPRTGLTIAAWSHSINIIDY